MTNSSKEDSKITIKDNEVVIENIKTDVKKDKGKLIDTPTNLRTSDEDLIKKPISLKFKEEEVTHKEEEINKIDIYNDLLPEYDIVTFHYFPEEIKKFVSLFKSLKIIFDFNRKRKLNVIFDKHKSSIEKMWKHSLNRHVLDQLKEMIPDTLKFKEVSYKEKNVEITSFLIKITKDICIEERIHFFINDRYKNWLIEHDINFKVKKYHPDFLKSLTDQYSVKRKQIFVGQNKKVKIKEDNSVKKKEDEKVNKSIEDKYNEIVERVKKLEEQRKLDFIKNESVKIDYLGKIDEIFEVTKKRAIKLEDLTYKMGGKKIKEEIIKSIKDTKYVYKKVDSIEYLVKE
ncbi:hypothetical protein A0H76_509 [Hepatospora eriocheir]|uniref:CDT1 Geminin-binding domain-containing protein n=1 Tax=Hepatospora eriocheir TaxID=1081669 RepID=A0A1X0QL40_9MICR|nr:hypothetical protein A0H76_509 [Hepatospora eriocheir]